MAGVFFKKGGEANSQDLFSAKRTHLPPVHASTLLSMRLGRTKREKVIYHQNEPISHVAFDVLRWVLRSGGLDPPGFSSKSPLERGFRGVFLI